MEGRADDRLDAGDGLRPVEQLARRARAAALQREARARARRGDPAGRAGRGADAMAGLQGPLRGARAGRRRPAGEIRAVRGRTRLE